MARQRKILFFKLFKTREFDYKPLYHDPEKKESELRKKDPGFRERLNKWEDSEYRKAKSQSVLRLVIITVILLGVVYYLLNGFH